MQSLNIFPPLSALAAKPSSRDLAAIGSQRPEWYFAHMLAQLSAMAGAGGGNLVTVEVTFTSDTAANATGDVLADTAAILGAVAQSGSASRLTQITLLDKDDQTAAQVDVVIFRSNVSLGTVNAAPSISDTNALEILGIVQIASGDFVDIGGAKLATKVLTQPLEVAPTTGTTLYAALITRGSPTQTANGLVGKFFFRQG